MLIARQKAGSTLFLQVALRLFGLADAAADYGARACGAAVGPAPPGAARVVHKAGPTSCKAGGGVHAYKRDVLHAETDHVAVDVCDVCARGRGAGGPWTCVFAVRSPLDRLVSSFLHVARNGSMAGRRFRADAGDATFEAFLDWLDARGGRDDETGGHAAAQSVRCLEAAPGAFAVAYVPLETVALGAFDAVAARTGLSLDASGLASDHYVDHDAHAGYVGDVPVSRLADASGAYPPYGAFFRNKTYALRCTLAADVALYRRACRQKWLRVHCRACAAECDRQVARLALHDPTPDRRTATRRATST